MLQKPKRVWSVWPKNSIGTPEHMRVPKWCSNSARVVHFLIGLKVHSSKYYVVNVLCSVKPRHLFKPSRFVGGWEWVVHIGKQVTKPRASLSKRERSIVKLEWSQDAKKEGSIPKLTFNYTDMIMMGLFSFRFGWMFARMRLLCTSSSFSADNIGWPTDQGLRCVVSSSFGTRL